MSHPTWIKLKSVICQKLFFCLPVPPCNELSKLDISHNLFSRNTLPPSPTFVHNIILVEIHNIINLYNKVVRFSSEIGIPNFPSYFIELNFCFGMVFSYFSNAPHTQVSSLYAKNVTASISYNKKVIYPLKLKFENSSFFYQSPPPLKKV